MKKNAIRESARGETCTFRIPGVCNNDPETVCLCHAPHPKKGMGIKGPDTWAAYGCSACHDFMDGRTGCGEISREAELVGKDLIWFHSIRETQGRLIAKGLIKT